LIVAGLFAWYRWSPEGTAAAEPKVTTGSAETIASAGNETAAAPQPAAVRGKFVAQHDPDTEPAESTGNQAVTPTPAMAAKTSKENVGNPRATWTVTPSPTPTPTSTPTPVPTFVNELSAPSDIVNRPLGVGPNERWIDVNLTRQTLVAYEGNKPVFQTLVSSGTWNHPTVTGQFRVWLRFQSQTMDGRRLGYNYYLENVPYVMYFYNDYALHGTFWHNNFGTPMSHGCVNLPTPAAEWIFYWSQIGTLVNVHY
jgi:lipoprotein-anchoring transpeptidase ErfK/SrfK